FLAVKGVNLFRLQEDLRNRLNRTIHDPSQKVLKSIINVQDDLNDYLLDLKRKRFKIRDINFTHPELEFSHDSINRNLKKTMDEYFHSLPEELEVISGDSIQLFEEGKQFEASVITIPFRKYIEFSFLTEFQPEIGRNINETQSMIFQNEAFIESYMMELKEKLGLVNVRENKKVLDESIKNLFNFSESSDLKVKNLHQKMEKSFEMILDKINVFYLIKNSRSLGRLTADENIYTSFYKKLLIKFRNLISNLFQNYLISKSKAILLNRKLRKETDSFSKKNHFLEVLEQFKLKEDVAKNLPFFYSNLFLDSILFDREFYVERVKQTEKAKQIFEKSKKGILLVYGEPQSGKSFFCDFIAGEFYPENKIFKLNLSEERCETQGDLYEFISDALKKDVTKTSFKENFPKKSALIIDDLELYWERKNGGNKILKEIFSLKNLIDEDSIIIINLNVFTFKLLWNIENIENYISGSIECGPFQPEEVKDVIWKKHKKTGYKINFLGKKEEYLTDFQISKLFHDIYDKSEGNIGHALKLWMLSIESLNESTLNMKFPPKIEVENLSHLGTMQLCILNQLVFHKALPLKKLAQLIELSVENTDELVENLSKYNLVFIDSQNYILLNPFIQKILLDYLKEKEII
ncbi:MAG: ATP-binding protein, partial [Leptospiraceae bacterium]|nr:ATP-binding protein [Leptospiraceae bacterium]